MLHDLDKGDVVELPVVESYRTLNLKALLMLDWAARRLFCVAVKELKLRYYVGETLLFTIYTHYRKLI